MRLIDLTGRRFGRYLVLHRSVDDGRKTAWKCICDCGSVRRVRGTHLTTGRSASCGCERDEKTSNRSKTHGLSKTRIYRIWRNMINRCYNERLRDYKNYGGRGIAVCDKWRNSFECFFSDMGIPPDSLSIDRINEIGRA